MPWTPADAKRFKKGLTPEEEKKWAAIANSHLEACIKKGGTDATCAGEAIKIANGSVGSKAKAHEAEVYFEPPESGDAPTGVKNILKSVYNSCRSAWVKDHPNDRENASNKESCSRIAWNAVKQAGWSKGDDGKWVKSPSGHTAYALHIPNEGYEIREVVYEKRDHIVVPVVMMTEGVHEGSAGPVLHLEEEFGKIAEAWNGIPIVIDHPKKEGVYVSANSPDIIEKNGVGKVFNTHVDDKKLKAEVWADKDKLRQRSPVALAAILNKEPLDVSIGVFSEDELITGVYKDEEKGSEEQYDSIARNLRPDHLALLPGGAGACSWEDGCGIRSNEKGGNEEEITDREISVIREKVYELLIDANSDPGYRELVEAAQRKLYSMDSSSVYHILHEIYDSNLVYEANMRIGGSKLFKQEYSYDGGTFELKGDPVEVVRKVEYISVASNNLVRTKFNSKTKEVLTMSNKCTPCVEKKVGELIANSQGKLTVDNDKEWLEALEEAQLDKLIEANKRPEPPTPKLELSEQDKADIAFARRFRMEKREKLIAGIQTNTSKEIWPDDMLKAMSDDMLERLFNSTKKEEEEVASYLLNAAGSRTNLNQHPEVDPLLPTGVVLEDEKK